MFFKSTRVVFGQALHLKKLQCAYVCMYQALCFHATAPRFQPAEVPAAEQPAVAPAEQPAEQLAQQPEVALTAVAQPARAEPEAQPAEQPAKRRRLADRLRDLA